MPPLSYSRSSVYTDNEKHFMKSCLHVFPVVSTCMIFFGLNSFSSLVSPEFSVTLCLQGTTTSFFQLRKNLREPSPCLSLPHPSQRLSSAAPPSFMNGDATSVHNTPYKVSSWSSTKPPECYFRSTGNKSSGISSHHTDDNIYPDWLSDLVLSTHFHFQLINSQFLVQILDMSLNDLALHSAEVYRIVCFFGIVVFSAWCPHLLPYWWCLPSSCHQQISKGPCYY